MALPQRKEPEDVRRENGAAESWCESDDDAVVRRNDVARRNDLLLRRRRTGWGWLWLIVIALFIWWAVWGWGNSGGWWRGRHNRMIAPGTNNGPAITPNGAPPANNNGNPPAPQQ